MYLVVGITRYFVSSTRFRLGIEFLFEVFYLM